MQPKRERFHLDISENKLQNERLKVAIENLQRTLEDNMQKINNSKKRNIEQLEEEEKLTEIQLKIKDSPDHYAKSAENLNIEIIGMNSELKELKEEIEKKQKICATFKTKMEQQKEQTEKLRA